MQLQDHKGYVSCAMEPGSGLMRSRWLMAVDSRGYREGLLHVCGLVRQQRARRWLYRGSRSYTPTVSDQKWIMEVLYPLLAQSGLSRFAVVVSEDVFAQAIAEELCRKSSAVFRGTVEMRSFPDPESAEEWLLAEG
jgi:hypothetical protein